MEIRPREWAGSALVVGADDCLRGRIQPFQAVQRSANAGRVRFAAPCRCVARKVRGYRLGPVGSMVQKG